MRTDFRPVLPLGLAYLAGVLLENGHEVHVIDCQGECKKPRIDEGLYTYRLSASTIQNRLRSFNPDFVGISCLFSSRFRSVLEIARIVKQVDRSIPVIVGGIHPTIEPHEVLGNMCIDYAVLGEGERTIINVVNYEKPESIDGFAYRDKDGRICVNPKTKFIEPLDGLPFPARQLFPWYFEDDIDAHTTSSTFAVNRNTAMLTSRGCPYNCTFCSIHTQWGYKWRARCPENVLTELILFKEQYRIRKVSFEDDNLSYDRKRMLKLCMLMIKERLDLEWNTPNGISVITLDHELLEFMYKAGCRSLNLTIESGDLSILKRMHKPVDLEKVRKIAESCRKIGIRTSGQFLIGIPGETALTLQHSLDFAKNIPLDDIGVSIATPYPKTQMYEECLQNGYINDIDFTSFETDSDARNTPSINTPWLCANEVLAFKKKFLTEFRERWEGIEICVPDVASSAL
jgi:radical SAM superfamily enzyme YgiQ (UPF0313 family)